LEACKIAKITTSIEQRGASEVHSSWCKDAVLLITVTFYYVQERRWFALDCEEDMGRHYSTSDFFRQMPKRLLAHYFHARGLLAELNFTAMKETKPDALFAAWLALPGGAEQDGCRILRNLRAELREGISRNSGRSSLAL
jgi:hypothetical protein